MVGGDSYHVALTPGDAKTLTVWCREIAAASSPRDAAVFRVVADIIEAAPSVHHLFFGTVPVRTRLWRRLPSP